jgi:hypothetical protein
MVERHETVELIAIQELTDNPLQAVTWLRMDSELPRLQQFRIEDMNPLFALPRLLIDDCKELLLPYRAIALMDIELPSIRQSSVLIQDPIWPKLRMDIPLPR